MVTFIILLVLLIALGLAQARWGFDSRDGIESPEWERRANFESLSHRA